jgi:hypothetical protein
MKNNKLTREETFEAIGHFATRPHNARYGEWAKIVSTMRNYNKDDDQERSLEQLQVFLERMEWRVRDARRQFGEL